MRDDPATTGEIERDLDETRSRLDATLGELEQRLAPGSMVEEAMTYFKEGGGMDMARNIGRGMRDNPVPMALIGVGVGWMIFNSTRREEFGPHGGHDRPWTSDRRVGDSADDNIYGSGLANTGMGIPRESSVYRRMPYEVAARDDLAVQAHEAGSALQRYPDEAESAFQERIHEARGAVLGLTRRAGEAAESFKHRVADAMHAAADRVGSMVQVAADMAGSVAGRGQVVARDAYGYGTSAAAGMRDMGSRSFDYVQERPLLLGALGIGVGAMIGMLVPSSGYERRMAGTVRRQLGETARDFAAEARDRAMHVADTVLDTAHDAARREGLTLPPGGVAAAARDGVADVAGRTRRVVEETVAAGQESIRREFAGEEASSTPVKQASAVNGGREKGAIG